MKDTFSYDGAKNVWQVFLKALPDWDLPPFNKNWDSRENEKQSPNPNFRSFFGFQQHPKKIGLSSEEKQKTEIFSRSFTTWCKSLRFWRTCQSAQARLNTSIARINFFWWMTFLGTFISMRTSEQLVFSGTFRLGCKTKFVNIDWEGIEKRGQKDLSNSMVTEIHFWLPKFSFRTKKSQKNQHRFGFKASKKHFLNVLFFFL